MGQEHQQQSQLLADTISKLESYLQAAEREVHRQQADISRVRFTIQVLRDGSDTSSISDYVKKMKMTSHLPDMSFSDNKMSSTSNGHPQVDTSQNNDASNEFKGRYLRSTKEWIAATVIASRTPMMPGEVFRMAQQAGIKMHKRYPYVVLKQLADAGRLRVEGRAYVGASSS